MIYVILFILAVLALCYADFHSDSNISYMVFSKVLAPIVSILALLLFFRYMVKL